MPGVFSVWHPVVLPGGRACAFDVTPQDLVQLESGTEELVGEFLRALGVLEAPVAWTVSPFSTPYYSYNPVAADWRDRYVLAWRVEAQFAEPLANWPQFPFWGPRLAGETDPTWERTPDSWTRPVRDCVVIADFTREGWQAFEREISAITVLRECTVTAVASTPLTVEARFGLGTLRLPEDAPRVDAVVEACRPHAMAVDWARALPRMDEMKLIDFQSRLEGPGFRPPWRSNPS